MRRSSQRIEGLMLEPGKCSCYAGFRCYPLCTCNVCDHSVEAHVEESLSRLTRPSDIAVLLQKRDHLKGERQ